MASRGFVGLGLALALCAGGCGGGGELPNGLLLAISRFEKGAGGAPKPHSELVFLSQRGGKWDYPIIEVNPNCWLEKRGEFVAAARKHGLTYPDLLERIIELAVARRAPAVS